MTFQEIFENDGYYFSKDFVKGFCFEIYGGVLLGVQYRDKDDLFPEKTNFSCYKSLFNKDYNKLLNKVQLFRQ